MGTDYPNRATEDAESAIGSIKRTLLVGALFAVVGVRLVTSGLYRRSRRPDEPRFSDSTAKNE